MKAVYSLSLFLLGVAANEETKMSEATKTKRALKSWKNPNGKDDTRVIKDGICSLTLKEPHRPFPTLSFCFRNSQKSCCMHT